MKFNIAECNRRITELSKERTKIYDDKLARIDKEITILQQRIKDICEHPGQLLITDIISYEDEYGKHLESSDRLRVVCTICNKTRYVLYRYIDNNKIPLSEILNFPQEHLDQLR